MSEFELHWNILRQEGRVLKAAVDLAKIQCKFIPKKYNSSQNEASSHQRIIGSVQSLKELENRLPSIRSLFGVTESERAQIHNAIILYNTKFKPYLRISIWQLISQSDAKERLKKVNIKKKQILEVINELQVFLAKKTTKFICGQKISIVDLLFYFDACNLTYFSKNPSHYENLWKWFQNVYKIKEIKIITHQWFAMAKQISPLFKKKRDSQSRL